MIQLDTIVVTGAGISDEKQEIESRKLRSHKVVDLAEILSDELVEVQMIRKSGYGNEVSIRGFGQEDAGLFGTVEWSIQTRPGTSTRMPVSSASQRGTS